MKIGLMFLRLSNGGGCYQLLNLARELEKKGHEVIVYTYFKPDSGFAREHLEGLTIKDCGVVFTNDKRVEWQMVGLVRFYFHIFKVIGSFYRMIQKESIEVLNPHEWLPHIAAVAYKRKKPQTRVVWMCNDVWHIPGGSEEGKEKRILFNWAKKLMALYEKRKSKEIDVITVLDHRIKKITQKYYKNNKIVVVRSGVNLDTYRDLPTKTEARKRLAISQEPFIVLCFSIFYKHRRFEDVIRAFEKLVSASKRNLRLLIVGSEAQDIKYAGMIKKMASKKNLNNRVEIITKYVTDQEKLNYLRAADLFVYPNNNQTWGLIVIEAMLANLACIVSSGAGVSEIIKDKENGFMYPVKKWQKLADIMDYGIKHPNELKKIGLIGSQYVRENLSWEKYAESMERAFKGKPQ